MIAFTVLDPGPRTTFQDLGRPGFAHLGVPASGAGDRPALMLANRLVGNAEGAAGLETTLAGPVLQAERPLTVALTGAPVDAELDGRPVAMNAPVPVPAGATLVLGPARERLRTYLAVRGGLAAPVVHFGSASADQLTGLGPPPLVTGDRLRLDDRALAPPAVDVAPVPAALAQPVLRVTLGPRDDWFAPDALTALLGEPFTVAPQLDRIGVRLHGPVLPWRQRRELRSEAMVSGALQVPPSGGPILLLSDHPATGGYPVIAVVGDDDLAIAAQLRPGATLRFRASPG